MTAAAELAATSSDPIPKAANSEPAAYEKDKLPDWSKIEIVDADSLRARWDLEKWSVIRELWRSHVQTTVFLMSSAGGNLPIDEAIKRASEELGEKATEDELERLASQSLDAITWSSLDRIFRSEPDLAQRLWEAVKEQALADFKSGHYAAALFEHTDWQTDVWRRAHFVSVFQEMAEEYKPRGAIELSMVEMVAVQYFLWRHWTMEHLRRATTEPRRESYDYQQWRERGDNWRIVRGGDRDHKVRYDPQYTNGYWDIPYQDEANAIGHALEMADRCRRAYHASLRALRDWRRYGIPVVINNPEQVNIAGDGAQQLNMQKLG